MRPSRIIPFTAPLFLCVACATPFPVQNLEAGMTVETVRREFGAPADTTQSSWTYVHEEQIWFDTFLASSVFFPPCLLTTVVALPFGVVEHWCDPVFPTVQKSPVVLHFEAEKLANWDVLDPHTDTWVGTDYSPDDSLFDDSLERNTARYRAMKKASKRRKESGLSNSERKQIKKYYKKVKKNSDMSTGQANKIRKKIKKVGK